VGAALGTKLVAATLPIVTPEGLSGYVDLIRGRAVLFSGDQGQSREEAIPPDLVEAAQAARERLVEAIAEGSDELLEKYLDAGKLEEEEIRTGLRNGTIGRTLVPVVCGSALRMIGVHAVLDAVLEWLASPADRPSVKAANPKTGDDVERAADAGAPVSAFVFKTMIDPFAGKLSIFRVMSGTLRADTSLWNAGRDVRERVGQILRLEGKKQQPVPEVVAGEIAAVAKLKDTVSGDTLCDEKDPVVYAALAESSPAISFAIEPKTKADEEKANQGLHRLLEEDLALRVHRDPQTREIILSGAGQLHVEVVVERLKRKYGVEVELKAPKVPYRETIKGKANAQGRYKKQSGGRGQYGDTWIEVDPLPRGKGFEFVDKIVGGVIPRQYIPAVEKGIRDAMHEGYLAGYPMQDVRVTLYD
ncbi:MAG: elongation factor G, partial [Candidatus Binatia bacterium]